LTFHFIFFVSKIVLKYFLEKDNYDILRVYYGIFEPGGFKEGYLD